VITGSVSEFFASAGSSRGASAMSEQQSGKLKWVQTRSYLYGSAPSVWPVQEGRPWACFDLVGFSGHHGVHLCLGQDNY
jgi:hypothetical protein